MGALTLLKANPSDPATFVGQGGYSTDGLGQTATGGTIQAAVPAGSAVQKAYLYGTYNNSANLAVPDPTLAERTIDFDGTSVVMTKISGILDSGTGFSLSTTRADVSAQVAAKVGSGGGATSFAVNSDPAALDGLALVVIYSNPALPATTIAVLDGSASQSGETATFTFAQPVDKSVPGFAARLSLGIGFSYQGVAGHDCSLTPQPTFPQVSTVNVNSQLLTGCAGNYDDGAPFSGALLTVGGVGDATDNPTPPASPATDDELYDIAPFMGQGDTQLAITSSNSSQDDNLFLAVIQITAAGSVTTEICNNGVDDDGDGLIDALDPDCGAPIAVDPTPPPNADGSRTFTFSSSDPSATFECSLDGGPFGTCSSPHTTPALSAGPHTFTVRALNSVGTPGPASVRTFTVAGAGGGGGGGGGGTPPTAAAAAVPRATTAQSLPAPTVARTANLEPVRGVVRVRLPGAAGFVLLSEARQIPMGSIVDTTGGEVRLTTASGSGARAVTQTANFYDGVFLLSQARSGLTDLRLANGRRAACLARGVRRSDASQSRRRRSKGGKVRRLWGDGSGQFRTTGHYSSATVRGTTWLVEDRCNATVTTVRKGVVAVRDFVRRRTITVRAPRTYVALRGPRR